MKIDSKAVLFVISTLVVGSAATADVVEPDDPNLRFVGRWDSSNVLAPWAQAQGSSIVLSFDGTSLGVTMNTSNQEYFRVIVDGDAQGSLRIQIPSGVPTALVSGLSDTVHEFELIKETDQGRATLLGFDLDPGKSLQAPSPALGRRMVFYGDSNLAGNSLTSERNQGGWAYVGTYYGLAGITARMFGAEYQNISKSGATIQSLDTSFDRIDWNASTPLYDFNAFDADVVVVNIGANDIFRPKSVNKQNYQILLGDLRAAHPGAHIVLFNAYGWDNNEPANYISEVVAESTDPNLSYAVFPWVFEQFHGCETDHSGMAQVLADHLTAVLGWSALPPDVVSGYGVDGDVANGSFESSAPFGGWGWRYFDDPGVSRIEDSAGAFDGSHYLQLKNGASSHQTNPANDGDTIRVTAWLRGAARGDEVDVTIGFRNQDQGAQIASPMYSETQTLTLSTAWQPYEVSVTAPAGLPAPVYSARVTFAESSGGTVEVDGVRVGEPVAGTFSRNAGLNPESYDTSLAVLGGQWTASVDLTTTGHSMAFVLGYTAPGTFSLPGGQVLLVLGSSLVQLPPLSGTTVLWTQSVPNDIALLGLVVYTQAAHFGGVIPFALSNSQDLLLGY